MLGAEMKIPRLCGKQRHSENVPAESVEEYYRRCLAVPFLDHIILELKNRFTDCQQHIPGGYAVIPELLNTTWKEDFMSICYAYVDDLECDSVIPELDMWERWWSY